MSKHEYSDLESMDILGVSEEELLTLRKRIDVKSGKLNDNNISAMRSLMSIDKPEKKRRGRPPKSKAAPHEKPEKQKPEYQQPCSPLGAPEEEEKHEESKPTPNEAQCTQETQVEREPQYFTLERVTALVKEAYAIGEAKGRSHITLSEASLHDLLGDK